MLSEALEQVEWLENKYRIKVVFEDPVPLCAIEKKYLPIKCQMCDLLDNCGGGCPISRNPEQGFAADYLSGECEKNE